MVRKYVVKEYNLIAFIGNHDQWNSSFYLVFFEKFASVRFSQSNNEERLWFFYLFLFLLHLNKIASWNISKQYQVYKTIYSDGWNSDLFGFTYGRTFFNQ